MFAPSLCCLCSHCRCASAVLAHRLRAPLPRSRRSRPKTNDPRLFWLDEIFDTKVSASGRRRRANGAKASMKTRSTNHMMSDSADENGMTSSTCPNKQQQQQQQLARESLSDRTDRRIARFDRVWRARVRRQFRGAVYRIFIIRPEHGIKAQWRRYVSFVCRCSLSGTALAARHRHRCDREPDYARTFRS